MLKVIREHYWASVAVTAILLGVVASVVEHVITKGVLGWVPLGNALLQRLVSGEMGVMV